MRRVTVTIDDDRERFEAFDLGTRWNGFVDYAVAAEVWERIQARLAELGQPLEPEEALEFSADADGRVDLGGGAFVILQDVEAEA